MRRARSQFSLHSGTICIEFYCVLQKTAIQSRDRTTHPQSPASELMSRRRIVDSGDTGGSGEGGGGIAVFFVFPAPSTSSTHSLSLPPPHSGTGEGEKGAERGGRQEGSSRSALHWRG